MGLLIYGLFLVILIIEVLIYKLNVMVIKKGNNCSNNCVGGCYYIKF